MESFVVCVASSSVRTFDSSTVQSVQTIVVCSAVQATGVLVGVVLSVTSQFFFFPNFH